VGDVDACVEGRVGGKTEEGSAKEGMCAEAVIALEVVEGGGDLDEGLEEGLFGAGEGEPDGLPMLVGLEELTVAVAAEAFG
jgi:hypothetical protein